MGLPQLTRSPRTMPLNPLVAAANRCVAVLPNSPDIEAYKLLRTQIMQKTEQEGGRAVMVTSPLPGEGKTTTAINLAFTFAREFKQTVLLVDCDFRRQRIHEMLGIKSEKGLVNHLLNDEPLSDLIIWPGIEKLTLISGGRTIQESTEVLGSPRMKALVQDMKTRYPDRYIFFDVPAILDLRRRPGPRPPGRLHPHGRLGRRHPPLEVKRPSSFFPRRKYSA